MKIKVGYLLSLAGKLKKQKSDVILNTNLKIEETKPKEITSKKSASLIPQLFKLKILQS